MTAETTPPDVLPVSGAVDSAVLASLLDGEYGALRAQVKSYLVEHASFGREAEDWSTDEYRDQVRDMVVAAAESGLTASGFPAAYGGKDDVGGNVAAFETIAYGDLSVLVKFGVQFGLFGGAVHQLGTQRHHDAYLADIAQAKLLGSFAMTETGHGSNVQALGTTATYDPATDEFVIHTPDDSARKDYIGNAARHAQAAAVFAQLVVGGVNHGVHALFVPLRVSTGSTTEPGETLPGVRIEDCGKKLGLNGVDNGRIWFDQVRVPRENLLNRYGDVSADGVYSSPIESPDRRFFTMLGTLVQGRVCVGGAGITASKVALTIATRYAAERRQFGPPGEPESLLLDYGQHQRRLLPLIARTYALNFAQARLAQDFRDIFSDPEASDRRRRALESRAAATKALGTWHATRTIQECREACGGAGYLAVNRFAALKADTDVFTTFEGDNTILMQLVGKGRLTDLKDEFGSLDGVALAGFIGRQAIETLAEKTIARALVERLRDAARGQDGAEPGGDLLDHGYQLAMLRSREERVTASVARRLRSGMDSDMDAAEVFSRCQHHLLAAAAAHAERIVFEAFLTKVQAMPEGPERDLMSQVASLHALAEIERDRAWWLEHGRLSTERAKAITRAVDALCRDLSKHALTLVDAFGVPEELLPQEI